MGARGYNSDKNLVLFFSLLLLWTWTAGLLPFFLGLTGTPFGTFIFYSGGGAPPIIAVILVFMTYSREARKDYFHRCFSIKKWACAGHFLPSACSRLLQWWPYFLASGTRWNYRE